MAARYVLYYWPIPFRAQFAGYVMAYAGVAWEEPDRDAVMAVYRSAVADQPVPFMGPPLLEDRETGVWLSQMPAITSYLGEVHGMMPGTPEQDAMTLKLLGDCADVLAEMTRDMGAKMWTDDSWAQFAQTRLVRWLTIFEALGARNGLEDARGTILGTDAPGVADLVTAALWATMAEKLPDLAPYLARHAPNVVALAARVSQEPALLALRADQARAWGDVWCEGEIEASLREVLARWPERNGPKA